MSRVIILDSGPLGALANPHETSHSQRIKAWLRSRIVDGDIVVIPDIADYEVRRELVRASLKNSIRSLDSLRQKLEIASIDTDQLQEAASLWAQARNSGRQAASNLALDGDMILIAQARAAQRQWGYLADSVVIATTNVRHLQEFTQAKLWSEIN